MMMLCLYVASVKLVWEGEVLMRVVRLKLLP